MKFGTLINIALAVFGLSALAQFIWIGMSWSSGTLSQFAALLWGGILLIFTTVIVAAVLLLRKRIWVHDPDSAAWKVLTRTARKQFDQARSRARVINLSPESVPWYLFLAHEKPKRSTAMAELGYVMFGNPVTHGGLTVTTWTSPTAIAYRIEISDSSDLSFDFINYVLKLLFRNRPGLAANAAFVECELAGLMQSGGAENTSTSSINRILNVATFEFGLDLPIHALLVGLEHFPDLARSAILSEKIGGSEIFGGFLPRKGDGIERQIDALFDEIIKTLNDARLPALQKQLSQEFCASLVNGPMQLAMVQARLRDRAVALTQPLPPRCKALDLDSIVFVGARAAMAAVDPLSQVVGQRYFGTPPVALQADMAQESVTSDNAGLLAQLYHREGFLVKPNLRRQVQTSVRRSVWSLFLAAVVVVFGLLLLDNYAAYQRVNKQLHTAFSNYYDGVTGLGSNSDVLVRRVLELQPLRQGLDEYEAIARFPHRRWLPNWSLHSSYQALYDQELTGAFQQTLVNYLEKEIFAFNSLRDGVELIHLASVEAQFHSDQARYSTDLTSFFETGLAAEGEISSEFQSGFHVVLQNLFTLNQPPESRNENLLEVVAKTLSGLNKVDLLYISLMRQATYAQRTDLRQLLGPHAVEVFTPISNAQSYLVPRAYTADGFNTLFSNGEIPELETMIRSYEAIIGRLDPAEINAITRQVAQAYTSDYIAHWTEFTDALSLRDIDGWADAQIMMAALTSTADNPLTLLAQAMQANLDIPVYLPTAPAADDAQEDAPATPPVPAPHTANSAAATAFNIRSAFRPYLEAAQTDPEGNNQYDLFLQYAADVNLWLEEAAGAANGAGAYLFEQFRAEEQTSPLATFNVYVLRSNINLIRNFGRTLAGTLDDQAMGFIYQYIDAQWEQQILTPHSTSLESRFPFAPRSDLDISLIEFSDLFGPEGKLLSFSTTYLSHFRGVDGNFRSRPTFLLSGSTELSSGASQAFTRFSEISETMFVDGKPYLEFNIRPGYLDSVLSKMSVTSGVTLFQYSHGPISWSKQAWPASGIQNSNLQMRLFQRSRAVLNANYVGPWSWFRLAKGGNAILNPSLGLADATFIGQEGYAKLQFDAGQRYNPFSPGFFTDFDLPLSLFTDENSDTVAPEDDEAQPNL